MQKPFGIAPSGEAATLYTITNGVMTAQITDFGATLVSLFVPDKSGNTDDIVLGFGDVSGYAEDTSCMGAVVGRNANRIAGATFQLNGKTVNLFPNNNGNSLHSLPNGYSHRLWKLSSQTKNTIRFTLESPDGDQGFPGNATVRVTYTIEAPATLSVSYWAISDTDTLFNLTNHSFFNLAGHHRPELAMNQTLILPARTFAPSDANYIPTGEDRPVEGTAMDFRLGKTISQDIDMDDPCIKLQNGYDHTFEVFTEPCAILLDPVSGRSMAVVTDCPGIHLYSANFMDGRIGKGGTVYHARSGICLETQFYPDSVHKKHWKQPFVKAGIPYRSQTKFIFK